MSLPGFTAGRSISQPAEHFGAATRRLGSSIVRESQHVRMAKLPGGSAPGVHGTKCGPCGTFGWRNCVKTLDAVAIGEPYKSPCVGSCSPLPPFTVVGGQLYCQKCYLGGQATTFLCVFVPYS